MTRQGIRNILKAPVPAGYEILLDDERRCWYIECQRHIEDATGRIRYPVTLHAVAHDIPGKSRREESCPRGLVLCHIERITEEKSSRCAIRNEKGLFMFPSAIRARIQNHPGFDPVPSTIPELVMARLAALCGYTPPGSEREMKVDACHFLITEEYRGLAMIITLQPFPDPWLLRAQGKKMACFLDIFTGSKPGSFITSLFLNEDADKATRDTIMQSFISGWRYRWSVPWLLWFLVWNFAEPFRGALHPLDRVLLCHCPEEPAIARLDDLDPLIIKLSRTRIRNRLSPEELADRIILLIEGIIQQPD